jgi:spermidine/putrescine transport system substrate-binding protein
MKLKTALTAIFFALLMGTANFAPAQAPQKLYLFTWSNFIDRELFDRFTKETGIEIVTDMMDSNEAMMAKLQSGAAYDVVSASSYYVEPVIAAGLVMPVDFSRELSNWKNLRDFARAPDYDSGHITVPNSFGTLGIVVNHKMYKGTFKTWADFYKPNPALKGKVGMVDDPNATFTTVYAALGKPLCTEGTETYRAMEKLLLEQKPSVVSYSFAGAIERVGAGDVAAQLGWYTFVHQNLKVNKNLEYVVPKGPAYAWLETFFIPRNARNIEAAKKFLNFMLRPENSGHFNNFVGYVPPVAEAEAYLDTDLKKSPEFDIIKKRKLVFQKACAAEVIQNQTKIWESLMKQ